MKRILQQKQRCIQYGFVPYSEYKTFIAKSLSSCDKILLRVDRVRKLLEVLYMGPYKVLTQSTKNFMIYMNNGTYAQVA